MGKESYTEFIKTFGKSLQNAQPSMEAVQVLQGVCQVSAGNKGEQFWGGLFCFVFWFWWFFVFWGFFLGDCIMSLLPMIVNLLQRRQSLSVNKRCLHICAVCSWAAKKHSWKANQRHLEAWSVFWLEGCCWKLLLKHFQRRSFFQLVIFLPESFQVRCFFSKILASQKQSTPAKPQTI